MSTKIEWATESWNPVTGCTPVGEGCKNCYAKRQAERLQRMGVLKYRYGFKVKCWPTELDAKVLRKRKPQRIFVCSMSDLFHNSVPQAFLHLVWLTMTTPPANRHTYIIPTKRPKRMLSWMRFWMKAYPRTGMAPNIWLGVSVSTQREANELIPILRECPAAVRVVSYEPALEYIEWRPFVKDIDWLICGCESGPKRRHFDISWPREAQRACQEAGVPFFYKQACTDGNKVVHHPFLDGRRYEEYPR
ncbi:MAG: phage Gp37/Gp68 family protein [Phycisphaerae bacterium]|nr:phage Gp37/Gp68 family protein [Phycisphaerae bacterium]